MHIILILFFITTSVYANFNTTENKQIFIKHKGSIEAIIGGNSNQSNNNFNAQQNPRGIFNSQNTIEISDSQEKFKGILDITLGSNSYNDTSSIASINQGYIELRNLETQPIQMKMRFGLQQTAGTNLSVNSSTPMKHNQGINGNWLRFAFLPTILNTGYNSIFILQSKPLTSQGFASSYFLSDNTNYLQPSPYWSNANAGINFTTQRYSGFKFALSYQPTTNNFANPTKDFRGNTFTPQQQMFAKDITSVAINYLNEWNGIALNTSISGEFASIEKLSNTTFERNNLAQYSIGMNLSYIGLTFAGSYSNSGKSLYIKNDSNTQNTSDSYTADFGLSYTLGAYQAGISHIQSNFINNKMNTTLISLSNDISNIGNIKLTTIYELGFYNFSSGSYLSSSVLTQAPTVSGSFLSVGLKLGF